MADAPNHGETFKIAGVLYDWQKQIIDKKGDYVYWGFIFDDLTKRFQDCELIHTARIARVDADMVYTINGNVYRLADSAIGPELDSSDIYDAE